MINAYLEFLDWNEENEFPEIMAMDKERVIALAGRALRVCAGAAALAIAAGVPIIGQQTANRVALARELEILLQNVNTNK